MCKTKFELAQIIRDFGQEFNSKYKPNSWTLRILNALRICRTSALGGHVDKCDNCGKTHISYNSCKNRHCPKCQAAKQAFWVEDVANRIIDTKYFHVVFTVPEELNEICLLDSKLFYTTLFSSVWQTLRTAGYTNYATETGALAVLHTWGQNLSLHPHIHCLVPSAGISIDNKITRIGKNNKFLYPAKKLSPDFRSVMMKQLKKQLAKNNKLAEFQAVIDKAWAKKWVVFAEPSFAGADSVIKYLGQYTNRVAITNNRILNIDAENVIFRYKDYKDNGKQKVMRLSGIEFLRRFCMHILPKGFVKIRYYGILSNRYSKYTAMYRKSQTSKHDETPIQRIKRLLGFDVRKCPFCKTGTMHKIEIIPRIRSPTGFLIANIKTVKYM